MEAFTRSYTPTRTRRFVFFAALAVVAVVDGIVGRADVVAANDVGSVGDGSSSVTSTLMSDVDGSRLNSTNSMS